MPLNLGEVPDYYRRFIDPVDIVDSQDLPDGRERLLQLRRRPISGTARSIERARMVIVEVTPRPAVRLRRAERRPRQRGRLHHRGRPPAGRRSCRTRRRTRSTAPSRAASRPRSRMAPACRSASAACPTRSARCCSRAASATSAYTPKCSPTASSTSTRRAASPAPRKTLDPGQDRLHLRARIERPVCSDSTAIPTSLLPGRLHQPAAHHHAERPRDLDQQHDADRPAGPGRLRIRRPPPYERHRRATAVRARRVRVERRQVVHLPVLHLRASAASAGAGSSST